MPNSRENTVYVTLSNEIEALSGEMFDLMRKLVNEPYESTDNQYNDAERVGEMATTIKLLRKSRAAVEREHMRRQKEKSK